MKSSSRSRRRVAAIAVVAAALPFAGMASASASTTLWGCTVTPLRPVFDHINPANGNKVIRYNYTVTCAGGRTIEVNQHIHEQDGGLNADDHLASNVQSRTFATTGTVTMGWLLTMVTGEVGAEELYHTDSFRVTTTNLAQSGWTAFEDSPVQAFSN